MNRSPRTFAHRTIGDPLPLRGRGKGWLALSLLGILAAATPACPALADRAHGTAEQADVAPAQAPVEVAATGPASDPAERTGRRRGTKTPRVVGADGWWPGMAGIALALVVVGVAAVARRFAPRPPTGAVQVVGRVSLSPKHSVYMLRVGQRVLLLGAGPQGPPALIAELADVPEGPPALHQEDES